MNRMELRDNGAVSTDGPLYRALTVGDLPGAVAYRIVSAAAGP